MLTDEQHAEMERILKELAEKARAAPACFLCGHRCDPPFGDGKKCMVCASRPTGECMSMMIY